MSKRRVVITGLGIISPVGSTVEGAWQNILAGKSGIGPIQTFDVSAFPVRFHGPVAGFDAEKYLPAKDLRRMDPFMHYGYAAAIDAFKDSGITVTAENAARIGVAMGAGIGGLHTIEENYEKYVKVFPAEFSGRNVLSISTLIEGNVDDVLLTRWVDNLASSYGRVPARLANSQAMWQWTRARKMIRVTTRIDQGQRLVSVSLVDGPILDAL